MQKTRSKTKPLLALLAVLPFSIGVAACGGASKDTTSTAQASPKTATVSATVTSSSTPKAPAMIRPSEYDKYLKSVGQAASEPDKREITAVVKRFYADAAADNGTAACSLYITSMYNSIAEDYSQAPRPPSEGGKTCAIVMTKIFKHPPEITRAELGTTRVIGVRVNGNYGFAELHSKRLPFGELSVKRENGAWRIVSRIGSAN